MAVSRVQLAGVACADPAFRVRFSAHPQLLAVGGGGCLQSMVMHRTRLYQQVYWSAGREWLAPGEVAMASGSCRARGRRMLQQWASQTCFGVDSVSLVVHREMEVGVWQFVAGIRGG